MSSDAWKELGSIGDDAYDADNRSKVFEAIRVAQLLGYQIVAEYESQTIPAVPAVEGGTRGRPESKKVSLIFWATNQDNGA